MYNRNRRLPAVAVAVLLVVAIAGYVVGHGHSAAASGEDAHTIFAAGVQLNYPTGWDQVQTAPTIPDLPLTKPVALAPAAAAEAGLVIGQLPSGEPGLLPSKFVSRLKYFPHTQEVDLLNTQAYMYMQLVVPGFGQALTLFVIPDPGGSPTVLACHAPATLSAYMRTCQQIAATLTLVGQSQSYELAPEPAYATKVSAAIDALESERTALRQALAVRVPASTIGTLATHLSNGFASAAASLSAVEPSLVAGPAQAALSNALGQARTAYMALTAAANAESSFQTASAVKQVDEAEASVNTALEDFAFLGYE
jgi:hypothetical protein